MQKIFLQKYSFANEKGIEINSKEVTPFLLKRIVELTGGDSLESNIRLVINNAKLGAKVAKELCELRKWKPKENLETAWSN